MAVGVCFLLVCIFTVFSSLRLGSCSSSSLCPKDSDLFLYALHSQCPISISPNPPLQVDGDFLDRALASKLRNEYIVVLFHASWCPFSRSVLPSFETLSSKFPQIEHMTIEQSSAMPSIFSRYGIHSLPSILMVNRTSRVRYHGPKNLISLVQFYKKTTGLEPVQYFSENQPISLEGGEKSIFLSLNSLLLKEISKREPYLVFSILFICFRLIVRILPETSQVMGRILNMIDVRRVWTKLRLSKTRNFGTKNARVWASSLASVALGESSSARSSS
ncbi:hypothetical protein ACB098_09G131500 [Castanea mollissima]